MPHPRERAGFDQPAILDDRHVLAELLYLSEVVAGQEYGAALRGGLADAVGEDLHHKRVESGGRLVQDQQFCSGGEGGDDHDLLPVSRGIRAHPLAWVEGEALDEVPLGGDIVGSTEPGEDVEDLLSGEVAPQGDVAGDVGDPPRDLRRVCAGVQAEDAHIACGAAVEAEEDADSRGLAGSVGAEEAVDCTGLDDEVEPVDGAEPAERLNEPMALDGVRGRRALELDRSLGAFAVVGWDMPVLLPEAARPVVARPARSVTAARNSLCIGSGKTRETSSMTDGGRLAPNWAMTSTKPGPSVRTIRSTVRSTKESITAPTSPGGSPAAISTRCCSSPKSARASSMAASSRLAANETTASGSIPR